MTTPSKHHLFNQPTCVVEKILLQPALNILDRCAISQTCKTLHKFTSTLYSIFDFPLSPSNITSLSHKASLAIKPQELKCVPIIAVRSGVYNVAIGSDGDDYSAIFFNRKGIVRVVKVRTKKDGVSIECLYSVLVQRMLFTCTKFKDKVLLIESPPGKDYFAHTSTLRDIIEKFGKLALYKHSGIILNPSSSSSSSSNSTSQTSSISTDSSPTATTTANSSSSTASMKNSDDEAIVDVWQSTKQTRDLLLKGIVGMIRRFRQREQAYSKEFSTIGCGEQQWYIKALMQFHYKYLMCQQKLYVYGNSLRKRHTEIMNFLTNEFKGSLLSTFSNDWSNNNENELNSSNGLFSFVLMDRTKSSSSPSSKKLSRSISLSSSISSAEIENQLAQLNERHLFLRTLMEKFKSVILSNQGLESCSIVFRNFELQSIYEDLRTNLTKILHKHEKVSEVIETTAIKLQLILKNLYEQDIRNKYSAMNKELEGINTQLNNNDLKKSLAKTTTSALSSSFNSTTSLTTVPRLTTYINTFNNSSSLTSPSFAYVTTRTSPSTTITSTTPLTNEKRKDISKLAITIPHQSDHDLSAESILDALLLQIPFEHIFSRKMFIKLLAQRHFETMCAEYGDHTARIDYDDYCSSSNEDLSDDGFFNNNNNNNSSNVDNNDDSDFFHHHYYNSSGRSFFYDIETGQHVSQDYARKFFINWFEQTCKTFCHKLVGIGDWLNAACYILFIAKHLLKDDCNWVEQYDESEGVCTTEWRFEIVEKVENELINLTNNVIKPALLKRDEDNMIKVWKTWWLYACSEVLDNIETSNAKTVLEKMEDILEMKTSYAITSACSTCINKEKDKGKEKEAII
ncbi:hypothetical protein C1645_830851 [Glomus cerebriforme]|uniref:Uncharacterized protein n=1 Tax=Glomus cerebriforme TaxID=658196 RepID=A0A397SGU5_9GLOM|nr:hypothetical protein C1645_836166 [Glomus cerebriforme]RIA85413.1 hypothetical protein C1645_830851 [Glomus cerebriforme]